MSFVYRKFHQLDFLWLLTHNLKLYGEKCNSYTYTHIYIHIRMHTMKFGWGYKGCPWDTGATSRTGDPFRTGRGFNHFAQSETLFVASLWDATSCASWMNCLAWSNAEKRDSESVECVDGIVGQRLQSDLSKGTIHISISKFIASAKECGILTILTYSLQPPPKAFKLQPSAVTRGKAKLQMSYTYSISVYLPLCFGEWLQLDIGSISYVQASCANIMTAHLRGVVVYKWNISPIERGWKLEQRWGWINIPRSQCEMCHQFPHWFPHHPSQRWTLPLTGVLLKRLKHYLRTMIRAAFRNPAKITSLCQCRM